MSDRSQKKVRRVDTRGLPEDFDPHYFYEYRIMVRSKEATGVEGLIYRYMPHTVIRSFAFAIDPFSQFKVSRGRITPKNRVVTRSIQSVLNRQTWEQINYNVYTVSTKNYQNIPGREGPTRSWTTSKKTGGTYSLQSLTSTREDTTRRTRIIGSSQGEFEMFKPTLIVPDNVVRRVNTQYRHLPIVGSGVFPEINDSTVSVVTRVSPGASLSSSAINQIRTLERSHCSELIQKNALKLYGSLNPQFRNFSFFRELAELKDLPRSIVSMRDTVRDFRSLYNSFSDFSLRDKVFSLGEVVKDIPKEYVSYHFGWKLLVKSVQDLLAKPQTTSKQISMLIRRSGKPTTYRIKREFPSAVSTGIPGFGVLDIHPAQTFSTIKNRIERVVELRVVINTTFDFPEVNRIKFASRFFYEKLGVYPRPVDFYNLVPWSWLFDWFTGVGDYVNVIDEVNKDRSLINWGMISAISRGRLTTNATSKVTSQHTTQVSYSGTGTTTYVVAPHNYEASCAYVFHMRKDLAGIPGLRKTTDPSSLTPYQNSILGSILSERTRYRR